MWQAALWGAISGSAVLLGAIVALVVRIPKRVIGFIMAFGTGVLIGAAAYELLQESVQEGGLHPTMYGFLTGALVFTLFELILASRGGSHRKRSNPKEAAKKVAHAAKATGGSASKENNSGLAIFIGTMMDAVPESVMIGASLIGGASVSMLLVVAIFISNIPEGLSSTVGLRNSGYSKKRIALMWGAVLVCSTVSSMLGYSLLSHAPDDLLYGIAAFAAGGIVAMLASTMMPEAYEEGGPLVGLIAALGLLASLVLDSL